MPREALPTRLFWGALAAGLGAGLAAQVLVAVRPGDFTLHWFREPVQLAALHLTTLGFVGLLILGVLTQFLPMLLGRGLGSIALSGAALGLFGAGLAALVAVFLGWRFPGPAWAAGAGLLGGALVILALSGPALLRGGGRHALTRATLASSLAYLVGTALLGTLMAQGLVGFPRVSTGPLELIRLHAHLGLAGFGTLMVFGVSYALLPMFNLSKGWSPWPGWAALAAFHLGLGATALAALAGVRAVGRWADPLLALGTVFYLYQVRLIRAKAVRPAADASVQAYTWACACLVGAALWSCALQSRPAEPGADAGVVYLLLFGFLGGAIASQLLKIVPLLAWVDRFSGLVGRAATPSAGDLLDPLLARLVLPLHAAAVAVGCWGLASHGTGWLRLSGCLGTALFLDLGGIAVAARLRGAARVEPAAPQGAPA